MAAQRTLTVPGFELEVDDTSIVDGEVFEAHAEGFMASDGQTGRMSRTSTYRTATSEGEIVRVDGAQYSGGSARQPYINAGVDSDATWIAEPTPVSVAIPGIDNPMQGMEFIHALADDTLTEVSREPGSLEETPVTIVTGRLALVDVVGRQMPIGPVLDSQPGMDDLASDLRDELIAWLEDQSFDVTIWISGDQVIRRVVTEIDMGSMAQIGERTEAVSAPITVDVWMTPLDALPEVVAPTDGVVWL